MYVEESHFIDTHDPSFLGVEGGGGVGCYATSSTNSMEEQHMNMKVHVPTFSLDDLTSHHQHQHHQTEEAMAQAAFELEHEFNTHLMQDVLNDPNNLNNNGSMQHIQQPFDHQQNWASQVQELQNMQNMSTQCYNSSSFNPSQFASVAPTPDLLNLLQLPRCSVSSMLPNTSISFGNPKNSLDIFGEHTMLDNGSASNPVLYDPPLHLNLPPQPPIFKELFNTLPHGYSLPNSRGGGGGSYFDGVDERDGLGGGGGGGGDGVYQDGNGRVLDFSREVSGLGKRGDKGPHFATEKQRREQLNEKYTAMRQLIPNPTKADRASIVADATEYIKELQRTVEELKILVDKKRCGRDRCKKLKTEDDGDMESSSLKPLSDREQSNVPLRCSWLQRKYKDTEVDVRIVDDEVTIKLIQKKKVNCLLTVSKILDELQLDLLHVSGGNIGVNYSFLFNTKIYEGSSVYAGAIAKKLLEAVDKNYATFPPAGF